MKMEIELTIVNEWCFQRLQSPKLVCFSRRCKATWLAYPLMVGHVLSFWVSQSEIPRMTRRWSLGMVNQAAANAMPNSWSSRCINPWRLDVFTLPIHIRKCRQAPKIGQNHRSGFWRHPSTNSATDLHEVRRTKSGLHIKIYCSYGR